MIEEAFLNEQEIEQVKRDVLKYSVWREGNEIKVDFSEPDKNKFIRFVQKTHLDPFLNQVYAVNRAGQMVIVVGVYGFLWSAERTGQYDGCESIQWCGEDGVWKDVWPHVDQNPVAARAVCYRKDRKFPEIGIAYWKGLVQTKKSYKGQPETPNQMWSNNGPSQLAKCAQVAAIKKLIPNLNAAYLPEELDSFDINSDSENHEPIKESSGVSQQISNVIPINKPTIKEEELDDQDIEAIQKMEAIESAKTEQEFNSAAFGNPKEDWYLNYVIPKSVIDHPIYANKKIKDLKDQHIMSAFNRFCPKIEKAMKEVPGPTDDQIKTAEAFILMKKYLDEKDIVK